MKQTHFYNHIPARFNLISKNFLDFYLRNTFPFLIFFAALFFILFYLLNYFTPLLGDDYSYSFICGTEQRVKSIRDIFESQCAHYFIWGGRVVVHFFAQLFLFIGKPAFNFINGFAYIFFTFLIYYHINAYKPIRVSLYVVINLLIWFFIPLYGEAMLWLTGASNYLWGTMIVLAFLLPYRLFSQNNKFRLNLWQTILFTLFALIAGCTNENTAGAAILLVLFFLFYYRKKMLIKIPVWAVSGLIAVCIGYFCMIMAPGNFIRAGEVESKHTLVVQLLIRLFFITRDLYLNMYSLFFIAGVLLALFVYHANNKFAEFKDIKTKILMYFITSIAAIYCMLLSPAFPLRTWMGPICYFFILIGLLYVNLPQEKIIKKITRLSLIFAILPFCVSYVYALSDAKQVSDFVNNRTSEIIRQKENGVTYIETTSIVADDIHNPRVTYDDVSSTTDFYSNQAISLYYGIDSIKAVRQDIYSEKRLTKFR